jgi:WD40 repeat protein
MPALSAITFSPDGSRLASVSSYDGATILVWDVASHKVIQVLEDHTYQGFANLIKFSQNGQLLAVIRPRGDTILIWTMDTGVLKHKLSHSHEVAAFAISPDNNRIASISRDELAIWNLAAETREAVCLLRIRGFRSCGKEAVAFSPDGELLAIGLPDGTVQLREAPNWEQVGDPLGGIRCSSAVHKVMFASKGTSLLFSSESAELGRADLLSGDLRLGRSLHCHMLSHGRGITSWNEVMFSPDGHLAASRPLHGADTTFAIFNMDEQMRGPTVDRHSAAVHAVSFSSCGSLIASTSADDGVKVWDSFHGTLLHTLAPDKPVRALFSPAGKLLIWPYGGNWVRQYEPKSAKLEGIFESGSDTIMALAVAPQGILMGTFSKSDVLKVWDMETGQNIACSTLPWQRSSIMRLRSMKFSPDGRVMVFATGDRLGMYDGTIGVWDWKAGVQFSPFSIRSGTITPDTFWFSRDGKMVAFEMQRSKSPQDRRVMLWDWKSGSFCQTQSRHSFLISAIAFSPKNDLVASASRDETVKLWDAFTGQLRVALAVGTKVFEMSFSDDASSLQTNRGRLDISSSLEIAASAAPAREQKKLDFGTNVFVKDRFIARGLEDVLWLPPEYVASCAAVHGNRVAIGHESGRVTFFTFDFSRLPVPPTLSSIRYAFGGGKDDTKRRRRATTTTDDENDDDDENDNDNNKDGVDNRRRREKRTR